MDDFANGSFTITFDIDGIEVTWPIEVANGSMTISPEGDRSVTFKLQSSTVPTPTEAGEIVEKGDASTKSSKTNDSDNDHEPFTLQMTCDVESTDSSVTVTMFYTYFNETYTSTWTIHGSDITLRYPEGQEYKSFTYPKYDQTVESLKADAEESCKTMTDLYNQT